MRMSTDNDRDGITLLEQDHRTVERLYEEYQSATDAERKQQIVHTITRELSVHAEIEEMHLYPLVADLVDGGEELSEHSKEEHQEVKETLDQIDSMSVGDEGFDEKLAEMMADVSHHVAEEESELFPKLRSAVDSERLLEVGHKLETAKATAPTRPHPGAPNNSIGSKLLGPGTAMVDKARDMARNFADEK
jgi:hemerythrin superfamily protein